MSEQDCILNMWSDEVSRPAVRASSRVPDAEARRSGRSDTAAHHRRGGSAAHQHRSLRGLDERRCRRGRRDPRDPVPPLRRRWTSCSRACMTHWRALHPPPDVERWRAIPGFERRLRTALDELYGWYARNSEDLYPIYRDASPYPGIEPARATPDERAPGRCDPRGLSGHRSRAGSASAPRSATRCASGRGTRWPWTRDCRRARLPRWRRTSSWRRGARPRG